MKALLVPTNGEPHEIEDICPNCDGKGWVSGIEAGHGCDGTDEDCARTCPIPLQTQEGCGECEGKGRLLFTEVGKLVQIWNEPSTATTMHGLKRGAAK